ncbi:hypothetical protein ANN_04777 [Periplaneta americana]|uniref:Reverse transcriptase domain-containing protein n=1 Tax=Periplaneta americana TaxID=6978 RepID=A0ABQ8T9C2_PERAM|nr:hypothetical protein ANN_04777 [Periplaneta americana]
MFSARGEIECDNFHVRIKSVFPLPLPNQIMSPDLDVYFSRVRHRTAFTLACNSMPQNIFSQVPYSRKILASVPLSTSESKFHNNTKQPASTDILNARYGVKFITKCIKEDVFNDDLIIIQKNEDDLQKSLHELNEICKLYDLKISVRKTKTMAFRGKHPMRSKIILENQSIEQVSSFKYLDCDMSYNMERDIDSKINKFQTGERRRENSAYAKRHTNVIEGSGIMDGGTNSFFMFPSLSSPVLQPLSNKFMERIQPVLTRWGTWLDAVNYYAEHYGKIMEVIDALDSTDSSAVAAVKSLPSEQLLEDILFIDSNFKIVSKTSSC